MPDAAQPAEPPELAPEPGEAQAPAARVPPTLHVPMSGCGASPEPLAPHPAAQLRRQAEALLRQKAARPPEDPGDLSPAQIRQTLHEIQVHQLELELLNDELRRTQEELTASRADYFDLYDLAPAGYCTLSAAGLIVQANLTLSILLGVARSQLLHQPFSRFVAPEDQPTYYQDLRQPLTAGELRGCELRLVKEDHTIFWGHLAATPAQATDGAPVLRIVLSDITQHKATAAALARTAHEWQTTFDATNDAIWILDKDHRVVRTNKMAETFFHRPCGEMLGQPCWAIVCGTPAPHPQCPFQRARQSGRRELLELRVGARDFEIRVDPIFDPAGQFEGAVHSVTDITEKQQRIIKSQRAQRLESIGALAGGLAHDLNNILSPILMSAPMLSEMVSDPEGRELAEHIGTCAQRAADVVRQLLLFARGQPGERVPVPIGHLLNEMHLLMRETFPRNIEPRVPTPQVLWSVMGDTTQIHQALMNLCVNARDAMPQGGRLTLAAENQAVDERLAASTDGAKPGDYVCLSVSDTGTGIAPEHLERIFEPFFTTKELGKGTGLGLASVLGIVRGHGGFVRIQSRAGQGTTFQFYLPASREAKAAPTPAPPLPPARGQREWILLVDDEPAVRDVLRRILEQHGYQVLEAADGTDALALFGLHRAEVRAVVTDLMMPHLDGLTLARLLRQMEARLPILGMTGLAQQANLQGTDAGLLQGLLAKPFGANKLLAALSEALASGQQR